MRRALVLLCFVLLACDKREPTREAASAKPSVAPAPTSVSAAPAASVAARDKAQQPWFVGSWSGSYEAQPYAIETPKGEGLKQWTKDDDKQGSGTGKISLEIDFEGRISGSASGPLGDMTASGEVDDDTFRVQLRPTVPTDTSFHGFFIAKRRGAQIEGRLQASSGDSLKVRDAPLSLARAGAQK